MGVSASLKFSACAEELNENILAELYRRGVRVTQELRKAELEVLSGSRGGAKYKSLPNRSSAPGEPPAAQSGKLRQEWDDETARQGNGHFARITSSIKSNTEYAAYLEEGTGHMASRPFVDRILEKAGQRITEIMGEPYGPHI